MTKMWVYWGELISKGQILARKMKISFKKLWRGRENSMGGKNSDICKRINIVM